MHSFEYLVHRVSDAWDDDVKVYVFEVVLDCALFGMSLLSWTMCDRPKGCLAYRHKVNNSFSLLEAVGLYSSLKVRRENMWAFFAQALMWQHLSPLGRENGLGLSFGVRLTNLP